jgi:Skp family chaperone for outer membrane proteins
MRGSAIAASLAAMLVTFSGVAAFAQAAGQTPRPAQPAPAQTPAQPPAAAAPAPAPAQPPAPFPAGAKVAYINPPRIFSESIDGKAALARVQALTTKKTNEAQAKQKALADNQQKLQASGGVMSEAARGQLEKEIERQNTDMTRFQQDAQAEINELQNEVQADFVRKASPIIESIAKEKGLQLLFNAAEAGFAWADPGLDLSTEVIKKLDANAKPAATPK